MGSLCTTLPELSTIAAIAVIGYCRCISIGSRRYQTHCLQTSIAESRESVNVHAGILASPYVPTDTTVTTTLPIIDIINFVRPVRQHAAILFMSRLGT